MKITIYELLGMIKDGKAPKEVKREGHYYTYNEFEKDYYEGMGYDYEYLIKNTSNDRLNDEVEIIEEKKKIPEKLNNFTTSVGRVDDSNVEEYIQTLFEQQYEIFNKINSIIDYLKSKGE